MTEHKNGVTTDLTEAASEPVTREPQEQQKDTRWGYPSGDCG